MFSCCDYAEPEAGFLTEKELLTKSFLIGVDKSNILIFCVYLSIAGHLKGSGVCVGTKSGGLTWYLHRCLNFWVFAAEA